MVGVHSGGVISGLRFGVLGRLEVWRGAEPVRVPTGRRRAVLACLLVHAGRLVTADVLIEAGWGDDLPEEPRAALNTVLSRLRTALGSDSISSRGAGYTLEVGEGSVDAHRFDALRVRAKSAPVERAAALLEEALALWRGPAYTEFADRDFAAPEAQRLERLRLDAIEEHASAMIDAGDHEAAVAELEALLVEHRFNERAVQLLMTALYRAGRQADALARYRSYREVLADELGLDPSPALRDLESRILGHDLPPSAGRRETVKSPVWLDTSTAFLGRDATLGELATAVASDRMVTVTGIGGVGKTRLVAQALPMLSERMRVPITIVELASVRPGRVGAAVADAFGLRPEADSVIGDVVEYLSIVHALVVLDNCEHVRQEVATFADAVMRRCPRVRLVATSRHRLGVSSERVLPLAPFPVPGGGAPAGLDSNPAVLLFADRVRRLRPSFGLAAENVEPVVEICRRLDGLPLALELAASRAATFGVEPVLDWLVADPAGEPFRDLRDVVEWSARLLTTEQRRLLADVAVFAGEFDADGVAGVSARLGPWEDEGGMVAGLEELVESNLLASQGQGRVVNYRMLALVRSYVSQHQTESGEGERARLAHAQWVGDVVAQAAHEWISGNAAVADGRLTRIGPDLTTALRWALNAGRLDVAAPITGAVKLCLHWLPGVELGDLIVEVAEQCAGAVEPAPELSLGVAAGAMARAERGDVQQARHLANAALASSVDDLPRLLAWMALGVSTFYSGDHEESAAWLQRVADLPELALGYRVEPHITRALLACYHDDLAGARESVRAALVGAEAAGAEAAHAFALYASGEIEARDDPASGIALFGEAAARAERIGSAHVSQVARLALFAMLVRRGRHEEALDLVVPLLHDVRRAGAWPQVWTTLRIVAELLTARDRREEAVFLLAAADAAPAAPPLVGADIARYASLSEELRGYLGASAAGRISALAAGLPRTQVVDRAATLLDDLACTAQGN